MYFVDHVGMFHQYAEIDNDEYTEMQVKVQDLRNVSELKTTPEVDGTGLNLTAATHAAMTQRFWVLNERWQAFTLVA